MSIKKVRSEFDWSPEKLFTEPQPEVLRRQLVNNRSENLNIAILNRDVANILGGYHFIIAASNESNRPLDKIRLKALNKVTQNSRRNTGSAFEHVARMTPSELREDQSLHEQDKRFNLSEGLSDKIEASSVSKIRSVDEVKMSHRIAQRDMLANAILAKTYFGENDASPAAPLTVSTTLHYFNHKMAEALKPIIAHTHEREPNKNKEQIAFEILSHVLEKDPPETKSPANRKKIDEILNISDDLPVNTKNNFYRSYYLLIRSMEDRTNYLNKEILKELRIDYLQHKLRSTDTDEVNILVDLQLEKERVALNEILSSSYFGPNKGDPKNAFGKVPELEEPSRNLADAIRPFVEARSQKYPQFSKQNIAFQMLEDMDKLVPLELSKLDTRAAAVNRLFDRSQARDPFVVSKDSAANFYEAMDPLYTRDAVRAEIDLDITPEKITTRHPWEKLLTRSERSALKISTEGQLNRVLSVKSFEEGEPDLIHYLPPRLQRNTRMPGELVNQRYEIVAGLDTVLPVDETRLRRVIDRSIISGREIPIEKRIVNHFATHNSEIVERPQREKKRRVEVDVEIVSETGAHKRPKTCENPSLSEQERLAEVRSATAAFLADEANEKQSSFNVERDASMVTPDQSPQSAQDRSRGRQASLNER